MMGKCMNIWIKLPNVRKEANAITGEGFIVKDLHIYSTCDIQPRNVSCRRQACMHHCDQWQFQILIVYIGFVEYETLSQAGLNSVGPGYNPEQTGLENYKLNCNLKQPLENTMIFLLISKLFIPFLGFFFFFFYLVFLI